MKNTKAYFNWHYIILVLFLLLAILEIAQNSLEHLYVMIPLMAPVGLVQIITAIGYSLSGDLPSHFRFDWRTYWLITVLYFVILTLLYQSEIATVIQNFWLFGTPWFIALYQFNLVCKIYKWRLSKQKDLQYQ